MDFGQWNKFPPDSGCNFPFPEAKASTPQAGNNSPLARAKSLGGSAFFHRPPVGRGGARRDRLWRAKVFCKSATRGKLITSFQPGTFCSEVSELGAAGARQAGGFPAWSWFRTQGWFRRGVELGQPAWLYLGLGQTFSLFCCWRCREGEAEKKMLSLVKRVFPLCLRPCWGDAREPDQKPSRTARAEVVQRLTGFPQAFKGSCSISHFLVLPEVKPPKETVLPHPDPCPIWQWQVALWICTGTWEPCTQWHCLSPLPVGTCCGCRGGGTGGPNLHWAWQTQPDR